MQKVGGQIRGSGTVTLHRCLTFLPSLHLLPSWRHREETDWPVLWGAASSRRIPKDTQWPQPAPTWWGAHSVCRRSSPSPTLRPKPRPSWVTCSSPYQQPINEANSPPQIQVWGWKQTPKRAEEEKLQGWMGRWVKYKIHSNGLKLLQAQHPPRPLAAAICTKLRRSSHFPGIPSHPAPPIGCPVCADPPPGGWNSWQPRARRLNITNPVSAPKYQPVCCLCVSYTSLVLRITNGLRSSLK